MFVHPVQLYGPENFVEDFGLSHDGVGPLIDNPSKRPGGQSILSYQEPIKVRKDENVPQCLCVYFN